MALPPRSCGDGTLGALEEEVTGAVVDAMQRRGRAVARAVVERVGTVLAGALAGALAAGLAVGIVLAGAAPAAAEDGATWQVRPAAADGATRAAFELGLEPGGSAADSVVVSNLGAAPLTLEVTAADIVTTPSGDVTLAPPDAEKRASAWVRLAVDRVEVAPQTAVEIPFTIDLPARAEPGDYAVALMTSLTQEVTDEEGGPAVLETRVGARLYLRVLGELRAELSVRDVVVDRVAGWWNPLPAPVRTDLTVRNTGTVRMDATARVALTGPFGWRLGTSAPRELPQLLPGDELRLSQAEVAGRSGTGPLEVAAVLAPFLLRAEVTVDAVEVSTGQEFTFRADASVTEVPWTLVALVVLAAGGLVLAVRRRRARAPGRAPAAGPDDVPTPVPGEPGDTAQETAASKGGTG